ncbi:C45 family autoproteolytic acyltransferase/hydolase [Aeromicrobium endophyticum]|uniref:C45 family autoproteolytic acyltransferase/hydolase n=1 Tax=Aeromicrobium endophyticum TaxID=2292704 RepID=UPI0011C3775E|nr:C45 family peptidase [Aeromicrobium endophyticum]
MTNGRRSSPAGGDLGTSNALPPTVVDISGDGRSRGEAHGESLRSTIDTALHRWRDHVAARHGLTPSRFVEVFLASTGFVQTVEQMAPDLHEEVLGIAAGSGQPLDEIWAYNLMDEEWRFQHDQGVGCSLLAARSTAPAGGVLMGQNMDLPSSMAGTQAALRIAAAADEPAQIVLTAAGMVGLFGVNRAGVGCCVNTLGGLPAGRSGLPVAFIVREILRRPNADAAVTWLKAVPHASGQHYAIGDRHSVRGFECSSEACVEGPPTERLVHTNHPIWADSPSSVEGDWGGLTTFARLEALLSIVPGIERAGDIESALSDPSAGLCVQPTSEVRTETFCSAEFTLSESPAVRVALGRPDTAEWFDLPWPDAS